MSAIAAHITSLTILYSTVYPGADQSKHQSSASLAFVWGIHRGPVNSPHKWPVTRKMFPFDDKSWQFYIILSCEQRHYGIKHTGALSVWMWPEWKWLTRSTCRSAIKILRYIQNISLVNCSIRHINIPWIPNVNIFQYKHHSSKNKKTMECKFKNIG